MDSEMMQERLAALIRELADMDDEDRAHTGLELADVFENARVRTFEEAGIVTRDRGLVIETEDGSEFQVTIVRSK